MSREIVNFTFAKMESPKVDRHLNCKLIRNKKKDILKFPSWKQLTSRSSTSG